MTNAGAYEVNYYLRDHLGNVRMVLNEDGSLLQETDYYPFGLEIDRNSPVVGLNARNETNRYNFLGKETEIATGYIDLQARFYDPTVGRFTTIDPETEGQLEFSPYHYSFNNPIRFSDPDGRFACCGGPGAMLLTEAKSQWEAVKRNATTFANNAEQALGKALSYTDVNDAAVVTTMLTRGSNAVNLDGTKATTTDKVLAIGGALVPLVGGSTLKKLGEGISEIPAVKQVIERLEIAISSENKIGRDLLNPPGKPGNSPTFKSDGKPVEIHHEGQSRTGPFVEMHPSDHRMGDNYRNNHPSGQTPLTKEERKEFNSARRQYWINEFPNQ
ncbi:RHS repeat-associated protein [Dyadobacter jejuensis]|uniref:RHS repeat-associated protein n=1 Tax=Dyadobacter jejuensis TaxID=1082580 RepID=A0A316A683_9BACT|nr:RHS repeat-associated core domain-containing protein [Dyadobacter jejuensis]PWJ53083.1 RHS repeat-associated protein [Dyadobacter jejuensis]